MQTISNELFYSRLPVNEIPLIELLMEEHLFYKIPPDWHVVITDVKNSTAAIQEGLHETINLVATGSIVAVLNIVYKFNFTVPFFFGGDGATFILPASILHKVLTALYQHRANIKSNFNLDLRVGHVSVSEIYLEKHTLNISKLKTGEKFDIPVLLGDGLIYAEEKIKGIEYKFDTTEVIENELDLSGMQCRWDKIKPPENYFEVISLLVVACDGVKQSQTFKKVMESIDKIYGTPKKRTPISIGKLKLNATLSRIWVYFAHPGFHFKPYS